MRPGPYNFERKRNSNNFFHVTQSTHVKVKMEYQHLTILCILVRTCLCQSYFFNSMTKVLKYCPLTIVIVIESANGEQ